MKETTVAPEEFEAMLLVLNQHGFMWIMAGHELDVARKLISDGLALLDEYYEDHPVRLEITYLGIQNANSLKAVMR